MAKAFDTALLKRNRSAIVDFLINNGAKVDGYSLKMSPGLQGLIDKVHKLPNQKEEKKEQAEQAAKMIKDLETDHWQELKELNEKVPRWMKLLRTVSSKILDDMEWHDVKRKLAEPDCSLFNRRFSKVPAFHPLPVIAS